MNVKYATANTYVAMPDGSRVRLVKGSHWPADDPIVQSHPDLFSGDARYGLMYTVEPDGYDAPVIETATAAPGEKRNTRRG